MKPQTKHALVGLAVTIGLLALFIWMERNFHLPPCPKTSIEEVAKWQQILKLLEEAAIRSVAIPSNYLNENPTSYVIAKAQHQIFLKEIGFAERTNAPEDQ